MERGKINHVARRQQIIDVSGLRYGKKTSTDVDGYLDFGDKASVFFDVKLENTPIQPGQRLAFERLCDDVAAKKPAIFIIADHAIYDAEKEIPAHSCLVREYRYEGMWKPGNAKLPMLIDLVEGFLKKHGLKNEIPTNLDEDGNPKDDSWMK